MKRKALFVLVCLLTGSMLAACGGPSQAELDAQATKIAADIFATQTAEAPTPTNTPPPTNTPTKTPTSTPIPTDTSTPTNTPTSTPTPTPEPTSTSTPTPTPEPTSTPALTSTMEPTQPPGPAQTSMPIPTPSTPMTSYESAQYPLTIQYPAQWAEQPEQEGITVMYADDSAGFAISEEDLVALGVGEMTLEEYTDLVAFVVAQGFEGFELVSRQRTVNAQGLPVQIIAFNAGPSGMIKASRLIYLHENKIGFSATYFALGARYQELQPLIDYSFSTFQMTE